MRFLADLGIAPRIADWLRDQGHDVVHLADLGLERITDPAVFELAIRHERILLTCELDFAEIVARHVEPRCAIVVVRLGDTRVETVRERLQRVLEGAPAVVGEGSVVLIEDDRDRVRTLQVGST